MLRSVSPMLILRATFALMLLSSNACCYPQTRYPSDEENPWRSEGKASYYHDSLHGNTTANGDIYDKNKLTAASRTLPFGTMVRVTRVDNGRTVTVRINDRGPFAQPEKRIIDLSRAAAEELDMIRAGVVDVRLEFLKIP